MNLQVNLAREMARDKNYPPDPARSKAIRLVENNVIACLVGMVLLQVIAIASFVVLVLLP
jgi:hypothetical protein